MGAARPLGWAAAVLGLGVAALVAHDLLHAPGRPSYRPVARPSALDARPAPPNVTADCDRRPSRWIVLAWDGASWDVLLPLLDAGEMPHLAGLIARGAHGNLLSFEPSLSPALWTSVATGLPPDRHGILGFDKRSHPLARRLERVRRLGRVRRELYTAADRRAPALWNLLGEAGRSVLVVGYHNTFPAERVHGLLVSNWLVQAQMRELMRADAPRLEAFATSLVFPPELTEEVLALERETRRTLEGELARLAALPDGERAALAAAEPSLEPGADRRPYFLRQAALLDAVHQALARRYYDRLRPDLALVHLQSLDLAGHYFLVFHDPERYAGMDWPPDERERLTLERPRYRDTLAAFYRRADSWLGELLALRDGDTAVMVLSDHGFEPEDDPRRGGEHSAAPPGILVLEGPGIARGRRIDGATLYDVLPTLAAALGLPLSRELVGRPLAEAFCPETWRALDPRYVERYAAAESWVPPISPPAELEERIGEELRSLGYVR